MQETKRNTIFVARGKIVISKYGGQLSRAVCCCAATRRDETRNTRLYLQIKCITLLYVQN